MASQPPPSRTPAAGGCMLAFGAVAGAIGGMMFGQASLGLLIGLGIGVLLALGVFVIDRR